MSKVQYAPLAAGYVAECIAEAACSGASVSHIAQTYSHNLQSDLERIKQRVDWVNTDDDAKLWIVQDTLSEMSGVEVDGDAVTLKPGKEIPDLKYRRKQIVFPVRIGFADGRKMFDQAAYSRIQEKREGDIGDLVENMRIEGWRPDSIILKDKNDGTVLSGNRRMAAVQKLAQEGIKIVPKVVELDFDDDADVDRFHHWVRSNNDRGKDLTSGQHDLIANHLRKCGLSSELIGQKLDLSPRRIRELTVGAKRQKIERRDSEVLRLLGYGLTQQHVAELTGVHQTTVMRIGGSAEMHQTDQPVDIVEEIDTKSKARNTRSGPTKRQVLINTILNDGPASYGDVVDRLKEVGGIPEGKSNKEELEMIERSIRTSLTKGEITSMGGFISLNDGSQVIVETTRESVQRMLDEYMPGYRIVKP